MREGTAEGNSGDRTVFSNLSAVRRTLLRDILDNWALFQELWDGILVGKLDSEIWGQYICVQTQMQSANATF